MNDGLKKFKKFKLIEISDEELKGRENIKEEIKKGGENGI